MITVFARFFSISRFSDRADSSGGVPNSRRSTIGRSNRCARCRRTATWPRERCNRRATSPGGRSSTSRSRTTSRKVGGSSSIASSSTRVSSREYTAASGDATSRRRRSGATRWVSAASGGRSRRSAIKQCFASWRTMVATQEQARGSPRGSPRYCQSFCSTMIQLSCARRAPSRRRQRRGGRGTGTGRCSTGSMSGCRGPATDTGRTLPASAPAASVSTCAPPVPFGPAWIARR